MYDSIIIGAGVTGLTAAYYLGAVEGRVLLVDPGRIGGVMQSSQRDGFLIEHGPNVLLAKPELLQLLDRLNLSDAVLPPIVARYRQEVWFDDRVAYVPKSFSAFCRTPLVPLSDKFMLPLRLLRTLRIDECGGQDLTVKSLFTQILGSSATAAMIEPALKGIYGGDIARLSGRALFERFWPGIADSEPIYRWLFRRSAHTRATHSGIFTLRRGNESLIDALRRGLTNTENLAATVRAIHTRGAHDAQGAFTVSTDRGEYVSRNLFVATHGAATAAYIAGVDRDLATALGSIRGAGLIVVHAAVPAAQIGPRRGSFGVLFPGGSSDILGVMFNSQLFVGRAPEGQELLTICLGGIGAEDLFARDDAELTAIVSRELLRCFAIVPQRYLALTRWPQAIPQYELGHYRIVEAMAAIEQRCPGLHFIGADRGGVGVADRVRVATQAAFRAVPERAMQAARQAASR